LTNRLVETTTFAPRRSTRAAQDSVGDDITLDLVRALDDL